MESNKADAKLATWWNGLFTAILINCVGGLFSSLWAHNVPMLIFTVAITTIVVLCWESSRRGMKEK